MSGRRGPGASGPSLIPRNNREGLCGSGSMSQLWCGRSSRWGEAGLVRPQDLGQLVSIEGVQEGRLRYFGATEFKEGIWCGIQCDAPVGKNNGSVQGKTYFSCPPKHGIFAPLAKVRLVIPRKGSTPTTTTSPPTSPSTLGQDNEGNLLPPYPHEEEGWRGSEGLDWSERGPGPVGALKRRRLEDGNRMSWSASSGLKCRKGGAGALVSLHNVKSALNLRDEMERVLTPPSFKLTFGGGGFYGSTPKLHTHTPPHQVQSPLDEEEDAKPTPRRPNILPLKEPTPGRVSGCGWDEGSECGLFGVSTPEFVNSLALSLPTSGPSSPEDDGPEPLLTDLTPRGSGAGEYWKGVAVEEQLLYQHLRSPSLDDLGELEDRPRLEDDGPPTPPPPPFKDPPPTSHPTHDKGGSDSDFNTEGSDGDNYGPCSTHCLKNRRARVIDGALYTSHLRKGGGRGELGGKGQDAQEITASASSSSEMESSGFYSDSTCSERNGSRGGSECWDRGSGLCCPPLPPQPQGRMKEEEEPILVMASPSSLPPHLSSRGAQEPFTSPHSPNSPQSPNSSFLQETLVERVTEGTGASQKESSGGWEEEPCPSAQGRSTSPPLPSLAAQGDGGTVKVNPPPRLTNNSSKGGKKARQKDTNPSPNSTRGSSIGSTRSTETGPPTTNKGALVGAKKSNKWDAVMSQINETKHKQINVRDVKSKVFNFQTNKGAGAKGGGGLKKEQVGVTKGGAGPSLPSRTSTFSDSSVEDLSVASNSKYRGKVVRGPGGLLKGASGLSKQIGTRKGEQGTKGPQGRKAVGKKGGEEALLKETGDGEEEKKKKKSGGARNGGGEGEGLGALVEGLRAQLRHLGAQNMKLQVTSAALCFVAQYLQTQREGEKERLESCLRMKSEELASASEALSLEREVRGKELEGLSERHTHRLNLLLEEQEAREGEGRKEMEGLRERNRDLEKRIQEQIQKSGDDLVKEVASLEVVVEMRCGELREGRRELFEARCRIEELEAMEEAWRAGGARVEDLEAQVERGRADRAHLALQLREEGDRVSSLTAQVQRLNLSLDTLQYQLKHQPPSP